MSKTATYSLIQSQTLASASGTILFSSIPSTFTDLILVTNTKSTSGESSDDVRHDVIINGDSTSGLYSTTYLWGTGVNTVSARDTARNQIDGVRQSGSSAGLGYAPFILNFMDYANTTTFKTILSRSSGMTNNTPTYNGPGNAVSLWRNTAAITSISVLARGGATSVGFATGSTFKLYGIEAYK
jgi:hypothetical protein